MRTLTAIVILTFLITLGCNNQTKTATDTSNLKSDTTAKESAIQIKTPDSTQSRNKVKYDSLPIHGALNQKQIDRYYPKILDTIKDRRIIGSDQVDIKNSNDIYVSMLHNTGTFDQMFLCTHDNKFNLLDTYYIGTSTMFDKTSHTIEYKIISDDKLEFHQVDWGYVKGNNENEIDTLNYSKYILTITKTGKIVKK
jgi:hypothetical protein